MKFVSKKITAAILAFVFIFSGIFSLAVSADTTATRESCVVDHFSNLNIDNGRYCPPSEYTCAYAAMSMLLSFYDSYWRDDIIDEAFDWKEGSYSSATDMLEYTFDARQETLKWAEWQLDKDNLAKDSFNAFSISYQGTFFESYLMSLGRTLGYHNSSDEEFLVWGYQMVDLLEHYLYNKRSMNEEKIAVHIYRSFDLGNSREDMLDLAATKIAAGSPVIYCGASINTQEIKIGTKAGDVVGAHAMIAYDVASNGDLLLHTGWINDEYTTSSATEYQYFNMIIWLEINEDNLPHVCTNNYLDTATNTNVCACNIYYNTHPAHASHNYQYDEYDSNYHWEECYCGATNAKTGHSLSYINTSSSKHYENCSDCAYHAYVAHSCTTAVNISSTQHQMVCACGYVGSTVSHTAGRYKQYNASKHYVYCACGYLIGTYNHNMVTTGRFARCTDCGYLADTFSDIIIKGVEDGTEPQNE